MQNMINCAAHQDSQSPVTPCSHTARPLRVLVVEDDAAILRLYQAVLPAWPLPLDVTYVNNGIDAMFEMRRMQPDLLVLDLNIPGINGLKVLHETVWQAGATAVVVTGMDEERIGRLGGIPSGVEVLSKPVPFTRLMAIAQKLSETKCGATTPVSV
jgi:DNA-binding response OmpR family regulator